MKINPHRDTPVEIEILFKPRRGMLTGAYLAVCLYRLTARVIRERKATGDTAEGALKAGIRLFRRQYPGRPFTATIVPTGAVLRGTVPGRRQARVQAQPVVRDMFVREAG